MSINLIGKDIEINRKRYDEALQMQGILVIYQYPNFAESNNQGEPLIDSYSEYIETHIIFENNPQIKTYRQYGWVVENDSDLPFLIHCSFYLKHLQKDCLFRIKGQYAEIGDRIFRVTELTYELQCPDHIVCQVVPVYGEQLPVGRTKTEVAKTFNTSSHFLKQNTDYRGDEYTTKEDVGNYLYKKDEKFNEK